MFQKLPEQAFSSAAKAASLSSVWRKAYGSTASLSTTGSVQPLPMAYPFGTEPP